MSELTLARDFILVFLTAFIGGIICKNLRLPLLLGYLLGGIFYTSFLTRFFPVSASINSIAEIGVAFLLFTLGLEFGLTKLKEFSEVIILGSLIQVLLTILLSIIVLSFLGMDFYTALFLGSVFSLSSTAVGLKTLSDRGELETLHGEMSAGWLFMQDLYTLPLIIILPTIGAITRGENVGMWSLFVFFRSIILSSVLFILIIVIGKRILPIVLEKIADFKSRELLLITAVLLCFLFAYLFQIFGFSYAVGSFIAGILLSSSSSTYGILAEVRPLRDLFSTVFFVSLGFIISPEFLVAFWPTILGIAILIILVKFMLVAILMIMFGYHTRTATLVGLSLISVGEFAFILAILGVESQLITHKAYMTILSVSFITLILSVPLFSIGDKIYYRIKHLVNRIPRLKDFFSRLDRLPLPQSQILTGHVVILGHGRVGRYICRALTSPNIPYVVVDYNHQLIKSLRQEGVDAIYGDPAEIDVLHFAQVEKAKVIILAYTDRYTQETVVANALSLNPDIKIIARTHFEEDGRTLKSLGVESVVQPEFEAALSMTKKLLRIFNTNNDDIKEKLISLRSTHGLE